MIKSKELRIAVTGANGFVGKNTRNLLLKKGVMLFGISRKNFLNNKYESKIISPDFNINYISSKLKNCDALIHLIGTGRQTIKSTYESVNVELTKKIVQLCKKTKIKKIVYISGLGVSSNTVLSYFISKYKAENEIITSGLDYTILRASYIIGKNDPLTNNLNGQIKSGKIIIPGSGKYHLQPIFVNDVAKVIYNSVVSKKFSNKIIELVGPELVTFKEFVNLFKGKTKLKIENMDLEHAYYDALHNPASRYGVDDLNIMIGDFVGNHNTLKKLCDFKFKKIREIL
ncbi:MAG: NAD-dependent epimerase/dehydratase family protein [Nitrosopumilaceae archaeon]